MTILLTGATGFIGSALTQHLHQKGHTFTVAVRRVTDNLHPSVQQIPVGDLLPDIDWTPALRNVDTIIHLAARVHIMSNSAADSLAEFRFMNTAVTFNLARQAAAAGVRRFIFLKSTAKLPNTTSRSPLRMFAILMILMLFPNTKLNKV